MQNTLLFFLSVLHSNISKDAQEPLSPLEVETVAHFIADWKTLALHLNLSEDGVREIEGANMRERDCCRRLLEVGAVEKTTMIDVLEEMEYYALADSLISERDHTCAEVHPLGKNIGYICYM